MTSPITTIVVGAGAAGCALAARVATDPDRRVILLEAGRASASTRADLRDAGSIRAAAPGHPANWSYPVLLTEDRPFGAARGRASGGSTAINGGYFVRAPRSDIESWARDGGDLWSWPRLLEGYRRLETDLDYGDTALHGGNGPVRVARPRAAGALTMAVLAGANELGIPAETDKNGDGAPGAGLVPMNVVGGVRRSAADAFLGSPSAASIELREGVEVTRVLVVDAVVTGVEVLIEGIASTIPADEVVLCAGNLASPMILLRSGIGPADQLGALGIPLAVDAPAVGTGLSDHPQAVVRWRPRPGVVDLDAPTIMAASIATSSGAGAPADDIELLPLLKPTSYLLGGESDGVLDLLVTLQRPRSRGIIRLRSADPGEPADIRYRYLANERDTRALRSGVRTALALLTTSAFSSVTARILEPEPRTSTDDVALDAWIRRTVGTSFHGCGGASFTATAGGPAVVDGSGRVLGVHGLRVADTSILPSVPGRGPAATAVLIGDLIAGAMLAP